MVHELSVQAVKIKLTIFDPPARLINLSELASAIGAGYAAAGLPCPAVSPETDPVSFRQTCVAELSRYAAVLPESLIFALQNYMPKGLKGKQYYFPKDNQNERRLYEQYLKLHRYIYGEDYQK